VAHIFNVNEAKTHLSELLKRAAAGDEIVIAKANKPMAKLVPIAPRPKKRIAGLNAGGITYIADDFDAPLPDEFWDGDPNDALNTWIREQRGKRGSLRATAQKKTKKRNSRRRGARLAR